MVGDELTRDAETRCGGGMCALCWSLLELTVGLETAPNSLSSKNVTPAQW